MRNSKLAALRAAFPYTVPIFAGFWFLAMAYGIQMSTSGFAFLVSDGHERRDLWRQSGIRRRQYAPVHRRRYDRVYDSDPGGVLNARTIVGADAHIGPLGNCESAVDSRKTLLSVGGQSRPPLQRLRVYLKTPNAPGQRAFLRCGAYHSARRVSLRVRND